MKKAILTCILILFHTFTFADWETPGFYGFPINSVGLGNEQVGHYTRLIAFRFKARHSGNVDRVRFFMKNNGTGGETGYWMGDCGDLSIELRTDDESANHFPTATVLASVVEYSPCETSFYPQYYFDSSAAVTAGTIYHIVFNNIDEDYFYNFVSVNGAWMSSPTSPRNPGFADNELGVSYYDSSWKSRENKTPIYELRWDDDFTQGIGYSDVLSASCDQIISGTNYKIRMAFTVSGSDVLVSDVNFFVRKEDTPSDLTVRLEKSDSTLIEQGTISAGDVPTSYGWVTYTFTQARPLESAESYNVLFTAATGTYRSLPWTEGSSFHSDTKFTDGEWEYMINGANWIQCVSGRDEAMIYFTIQPASLQGVSGSFTIQ